MGQPRGSEKVVLFIATIGLPVGNFRSSIRNFTLVIFVLVSLIVTALR